MIFFASLFLGVCILWLCPTREVHLTRLPGDTQVPAGPVVATVACRDIVGHPDQCMSMASDLCYVLLFLCSVES